ncbi:MAG: Dam family site-specific DNA-(adenine-N6)-methyltransferase [Dehalococcoidia bacterium]
MARPFLKWAGGKRQLLRALVERSPTPPPDGRATYYEPFLGGGALFFGLGWHGAAVLNDLNAELGQTFEVVRDAREQLVERLGALQTLYLDAGAEGRKELFYKIRGETPRAPVEIAARMIFLNKTCFNGLYRVNRKGGFNVPHGRYKSPRILDCETLAAASRVLCEATIESKDFEAACEPAKAGDFVYFDPPFQPLSRTSSFTSYTADDFGPDDQARLKECVDRLAERGVNVMVSNSSHPLIQGLYRGSAHFVQYRIDELSARRMINSRGDRRGAIAELVITSYDPACVQSTRRPVAAAPPAS